MPTFRDVQSFVLRPLECVPVRLTFGVAAFLGFFNMYMTRINLSIIILAMVKRNVSVTAFCAQNTEDPVCQGNYTTGEYITTGELDWNEATRGLVLSFFFYGYLITQIPGGRLAELYGTKRVFGGAILSSGLLTLLSPSAARLHPGALCALRFVMGLCQGVSWPSMNAMTVRWVPVSQRPRFISTVYFATTIGVVLTMPLCGVVIDAFSWDAAFYVTGGLSIAWSVLWWLVIFDNPEDHVRIKREELDLIVSSVRTSGTSEKRLRKFPWKSVFLSLPFWAILIPCSGNGFGLTVMLTQYPNFLESVYHYDIRTTGVAASLPFLFRYVGAVTLSCASDCLVNRGILRTVTARKLFCVIAFLGPAFAIMALIHFWTNMAAVYWLVCVAMFLNGAVTSSILVNPMDIAPNFASTLCGITNTGDNITGGIAPLLVGFIVTDKTPAQWLTVFWTCVPFYGVPALFFLLWASGSVQPWNFYGADEEEEAEKTETEQLMELE